ncbi:calcium-binding protein [Tropicibacter naphthalenivorans]|uniref:Cyclolysin n=1 Tax=Tropicibacter naphthalenivorans TaxID=441103 RepID=A0A0P1G9A9_9RHOB|nr:calcium-binding protein [Tropicibacter naphthalenivorans]CUH78149.1 Cyclolysin [Tropicibacter naphthalenivorans]SMC93370.1 Hemolysin-type calcium-binding repeat-containing protein [Tropicibacter naphthalenivorans]
MTTHILQGFYYNFDAADVAEEFSSATLELILNDSVTSISYTYDNTPDPAYPTTTLIDGLGTDVYGFSVNGGEMFSPDNDSYFVELSWDDAGGNPQTTTMLLMDLVAPDLGEFAFYIAGTPLPAMTTLAEFEAFNDNQITGLSDVPSGTTYAAGETIPLAAIGFTSSTENDTIQGSAENDSIDAGDGQDLVSGEEGNDTLLGGDSQDTLDGGIGNDSLLGELGNDVLSGGAGRDTLDGGASADDLSGGAGTDFLIGGYGDDTLDGGDDIDFADYTGFGGTITVSLATTAAQATGASGTDVLSNIENLIGGDYNDRFTGSTGDNLLDMGAGSDRAFGLGGDDTLFGGLGNDNLQGGSGEDSLDGGAGIDVLLGGAGNDYLNGDEGNDQLRGGDGMDILIGGIGRDVLIGGDYVALGFPGDGATDVFVFTDVSESSPGGATRDIIRDFEDGIDLINLALIDADMNTGDEDAFTFIGTSRFSGTAGELRYFNTGASTVVRGDVDGDGTADLDIFLNGVIALDASDFML